MDDMTTNKSSVLLHSDGAQLSDSRSITVPEKIEQRWEDIIMVDTGAGFVRSNEAQLSQLQELYDWIPEVVSCHNLNSGECFRYNITTQKKDEVSLAQVARVSRELNIVTTLKKMAVPAKVDDEGEDIIMIDTGAGFVRSNAHQLPQLQEVYDWVPTLVSCHNLNSGECFQYNVITQERNVRTLAQVEHVPREINLLTTLKKAVIPAKVDDEGEDIIMVDTGAGFVKSNAVELPMLQDLYDWVPAEVSCHNLNSDECFRYNVITQERELISLAQETSVSTKLNVLSTLKNIAVPATVDDEGEEIIMIDTGAGFVRSNVLELPQLQTLYNWVPALVSCQNLNSGECFKYDILTQEKYEISVAQVEKVPREINLLANLKNIVVPAKVNEDGEDIIMIDTGAGFVQSNVLELPQLQDLYDWFPTEVSCQNLNSGESFRYDIITHEKHEISLAQVENAPRELNLLANLKNIVTPTKVDEDGEDIIEVDTSAGFVKSSFSELPNLQKKYSWVPSLVSCRNLNSGECFQYNIETESKELITSAQAEDIAKDLIIVDSGAGFIRCVAAKLPELKTTYTWIPEVVNCRNENTSERFQYNTKAKKRVGDHESVAPSSPEVMIDEGVTDVLGSYRHILARPVSSSINEFPEALFIESEVKPTIGRTIPANKPDIRNMFKEHSYLMPFYLGQHSIGLGVTPTEHPILEMVGESSDQDLLAIEVISSPKALPSKVEEESSLVVPPKSAPKDFKFSHKEPKQNDFRGGVKYPLQRASQRKKSAVAPQVQLSFPSKEELHPERHSVCFDTFVGVDF